MVILTGIDGSPSSRQAARAAAALARLEQRPLLLAYVQEAVVLGLEPLAGATPIALADTIHLDADRERMTGVLEGEAERLGREFEIEVRHVIHTGLPDQELARIAADEQAETIVVGSHGRRSPLAWRLGSVAERLAQSSPVPLLVVRDPRPFERAARQEAPLAVALALGTGQPTAAAVEAVRGLAKLAPCVVTCVHVYDPLAEARRRGLRDPDAPAARQELEAALVRELEERAGALPAGTKARFVALPSRGEVAETLAELVDEERFDLVVLGAHRHGLLRRRFLGSVSATVLPMIEENALVVSPRAAAKLPRADAGRVQRVLVATDLSEAGNRAVDLALALQPPDSRLVLLHVLVPPEIPSGWIMGYHPGAYDAPGERRVKRALAEAELGKLAARVPEGAGEARIEVVEAGDVADAVLEAAERHDADLVCLGTHHYGRVASALIGSVARKVARRSTRPVLLVPSG